jgi:hypothetical protein
MVPRCPRQGRHNRTFLCGKTVAMSLGLLAPAAAGGVMSPLPEGDKPVVGGQHEGLQPGVDPQLVQ